MPFDALFHPVKIGGLTLKNRIVMPAMTTNFANRDGSITQRLIDYYEARAKGGVGLIIVEPACVDYPRGKGLINQLRISSDEDIDQYEKLARVVKAAGAKVALQLHHAGSLRMLAEAIGIPPIAPSSLKYRGFDTPVEMSEDLIEEVVQLYAAGASRAVQAGFDAIEFHGAHGYLISQFLSPISNRRTDRYGGSLENRARFFCEIIDQTQKTIGSDCPIICRINGDEYREGGITLEESREIAHHLETAGANAINVSIDSTPFRSEREIMSNVPPAGFADATWVHLAEGIKKEVSIPVIAVGRIHSPETAEKVLTENKADLIAIGRGLIADPRWPDKVKNGSFVDIRPCITCNTCIRRVVQQKIDAACAVNFKVGNEKEPGFEKSGPVKKVLIIGGGPAGMEAGRIAFLKGHQVEIWEQSPSLGGQLKPAAIPPGKERLARLSQYLIRQVEKSNIEVKLSTEYQPEKIEQLAPDVIVVATGSIPGMPAFDDCQPGLMICGRELLTENIQTGQNTLVVGGGEVGCEVVEFLLSSGRQLTIIEQKNQLAPEMDDIRKRRLMAKFKKHEVTIRLNSRLTNISPEGVEIASMDGTKTTVNFDTVVSTIESKADRNVWDHVGKADGETYLIGDALRPRSIKDAIWEGYLVGVRL